MEKHKTISAATAAAFAGEIAREISAQRRATKQAMFKKIEQSADFKQLTAALKEKVKLAAKVKRLAKSIEQKSKGRVSVRTYNDAPSLSEEYNLRIGQDELKEKIIVAVNIQGLTPVQAKAQFIREYL